MGMDRYSTFYEYINMTYGTYGIYPKIFAMDLNAQNTPSFLHVGGYQNNYNITWSELSSTLSIRLYQIPIYHLSLCGVDLFSNYSSNWITTLDTGTGCLLLPRDFFDMVIAWLPNVTCPYGDNVGNCELGENVSLDSLPYFQFQMSEEGPPLYFGIRDLLMEDENGNITRKLCLKKSYTSIEDAYSTEGPENKPTISFGTYVLRNLYTVFDLTTPNSVRSRVGFASKSIPSPSTIRKACAVPANCRARYYAPRNVCVDPQCPLYYFQEVDRVTMECKLSISFQVVTLVMLFMFALAHVFSYEMYVRFTQSTLVLHPHG